MSRDVIFHENIFPNQMLESYENDLILLPIPQSSTKTISKNESLSPPTINSFITFNPIRLSQPIETSK